MKSLAYLFSGILIGLVGALAIGQAEAQDKGGFVPPPVPNPWVLTLKIEADSAGNYETTCSGGQSHCRITAPHQNQCGDKHLVIMGGGTGDFQLQSISCGS